jgi:hypothetical protein
MKKLVMTAVAVGFFAVGSTVNFEAVEAGEIPCYSASSGSTPQNPFFVYCKGCVEKEGIHSGGSGTCSTGSSGGGMHQ